ncbi:MAG: pdtaR 1 [Hyphomicrobiales bacterium]|nr:pdtaR 1 [Hyphomicrobiales bacterium]
MARALRILVVEDEAILAMQLEDDIVAAGHEVVGFGMHASEAMRLADQLHPELALVDIHLADGPTGVGVARHMAANGIPVVFMTANVTRIPADFAGAVGVIGKPYTPASLRSGIDFIVARMNGEDPPAPRGAMVLSPEWRERQRGKRQ